MKQERSAHGLFFGVVRRMANKLPPEGRSAPKADGKAVRAAAVSIATKKDDITDEQIIECRRAYEAKEKSCRALADEHGVSYGRMRSILSYATRTFGIVKAGV